MDLDIDNVNLTTSQIPEPSGALLAGLGLLALAVSDSPRSLFYQTLIAPCGQGFFVAGLDHIL